MEYDMREFMGSCVTAYLDHTGLKREALRSVDTPFLPAPPGGGDFVSDDTEQGGELAHVACSVFMKLLYGARLARWDLLRAIGLLATRITKWSCPAPAGVLRQLHC